MDQIKSIASILKELDSNILFNLWDEYCNEKNPEGYIYYNEEENINELFYDNPYEAIRATRFGEYDFADDYFVINTYSNIISFLYAAFPFLTR